MCTVTLVPRGDGGVRVMCNRDEQRTRPAAVAPRLHRLGERVAVFPEDPQGGGTWIGANDAGLAAALLNRHGRDAPASRGAAVSRGLIIPTLLEHASLDAALEVVRELDPGVFEPFQLVAVQEARVGVATSTGRMLATRVSALVQPLLFTSSSLGDDRVDAPRRRLFERLVLGRADAWLEGQARFHRHRWRSRPQISVWMARADAVTVSRSVVEVTPRAIRMTYTPLVEPPDVVP